MSYVLEMDPFEYISHWHNYLMLKAQLFAILTVECSFSNEVRKSHCYKTGFFFSEFLQETAVNGKRYLRNRDKVCRKETIK